jgi:hypothetical protein
MQRDAVINECRRRVSAVRRIINAKLLGVVRITLRRIERLRRDASLSSYIPHEAKASIETRCHGETNSP